MIVTDVELYLADVHLPRACCSREGMLHAIHVWRRGKDWRKARRLLRKVMALRRRALLPGEAQLARLRLFGLNIQINEWLKPDEIYLVDGRRVVAGQRAWEGSQ